MISNKEFVRNCFGFFIILLAMAMFIAGLITYPIRHSKNQQNIIDSDVNIIKANDSLKIEVNNLDSIKNAKVIEVKNLSNDSTIKLFYELVKSK